MSTFSCAQQDTATQEQSLSRTRESELEEKIKVLEEARSDLVADVEKLEEQMKQLEILPSDIEQRAKVHIHVPCSLCVCVCVCVCLILLMNGVVLTPIRCEMPCCHGCACDLLTRVCDLCSQATKLS